ncbi:RNA polymerase sigma-70 factor [Prolixibacteraceae bacterium Z1-6]|uniref:RNA polymerase sigma-70 factor n=1 Tax=Draconibacterium aestuarii TaxID=2998507 RepID=A0A9X3F7C5_9BACT|nr:RNA polymerase sigma-70 factor [Prolixibacteraceae bacterium Z1-6]
MDEYNLIDGIKKGNENAYRDLYSKYYISLCYHAQKIVSDKDQAEEIVQLTFLKLWENRKKITITSSVHAYLYKAVLNSSLNFIKSKSARLDKRNVQLDNLNDYMAISQDNGYSIYIATELSSKIEDAINELPEKCRQIFEISRFEGKSYDEIASYLGISKNTVQKQISIALQKLKQSLKDYVLVLFTIPIVKK